MEALDVSIFDPLTSSYWRLVSSAAESVGATFDKARFGPFYARAREIVLTQSAARKAFFDSGITVNTDPDKILCRLAGRSMPCEASRMPLQAISIPRSESAFNAALDSTLNVHAQVSNSRGARDLKDIIQQANKAAIDSLHPFEEIVHREDVQLAVAEILSVYTACSSIANRHIRTQLRLQLQLRDHRLYS